MSELTILVSACGSPGSAALIRNLRANGEREVRLVGTDISERAVGRHRCDAFHLVPAGSDSGFPDAILEVCRRERVDVVLPQTSYDLAGLAAAKEQFGDVTLILPSSEAIRRCTDKADTYAFLDSVGVRAPAWRRAFGPAAVARAAEELGYPSREVCVKPVLSSGSRGFRVISASADRQAELFANRPGIPGSLRLEELLGAVPDESGPELLVMEYVEGPEHTVDGIASAGEILLAFTKTRESVRAGLAMFFATVANETLMSIAKDVVGALGVDHFFNVQLIGEHVIEVNPRISTIVYQEDLNVPWIGVRRALGELSDDDVRELQSRVRTTRRALRFFDQLEWDE